MRLDVDAKTAKLTCAGNPIETHIWEGQVHAFPMMAGIVAEGRAVLPLAVDFAERGLIQHINDATTGADLRRKNDGLHRPR